MTCVFLFYFKICIPSICSNLICFKVQMTLGVQLDLDKPMKSIFEPEENLNYFDKFMRLIYTKQDFWYYFNIINIWFGSVTSDGPQNTGQYTCQDYPHMDRCIGCHTRAFTAAYAVLWLEVLLHIKVFYIKHATIRGRGNEEAAALLILKNKKMLWFWEKRPCFVHPEVKFTIQI